MNRDPLIREAAERRVSASEKKRRKKKERRRRRRKYLLVSIAAVIAAAVIAARLTGIPDGEPGIETGESGSLYQAAGAGSAQEGQIGEQIDELRILEREYPQLEDVVKNISDYPQEAVDMFLTNRETIDYLTDYPKEYGKSHTMRISRKDYQGKIPMLLQWDERWGYESYGSGLIGWTGCGPTCLSMAAVGTDGVIRDGIRRKWRLSVRNHGYYTENAGTSWELMSDGAQKLGLAFRRDPARRKQDPLRAGRRRCRNLLGGAGRFYDRKDIIS